jgi:hypothetical protein
MAITDIPDRDGIVISTSNVELLAVMAGDGGGKYPAFMTFPSPDALIFLTKVIRSVPIFAVLHRGIFL